MQDSEVIKKVALVMEWEPIDPGQNDGKNWHKVKSGSKQDDAFLLGLLFSWATLGFAVKRAYDLGWELRVIQEGVYFSKEGCEPTDHFSIHARGSGNCYVRAAVLAFWDLLSNHQPGKPVGKAKE